MIFNLLKLNVHIEQTTVLSDQGYCPDRDSKPKTPVYSLLSQPSKSNILTALLLLQGLQKWMLMTIS